MRIYPYGHVIETTLGGDRANSSKAEAIFDRYAALPSKEEREAFVLALIAELLVSHARLSGRLHTELIRVHS